MNKTGTISVRLRKEDRERWQKMMSQIQSRYPLRVREAEILRQLIGFEQAKAITTEDRKLLLNPKVQK